MIGNTRREEREKTSSNKIILLLFYFRLFLYESDASSTRNTKPTTNLSLALLPNTSEKQFHGYNTRRSFRNFLVPKI